MAIISLLVGFVLIFAAGAIIVLNAIRIALKKTCKKLGYGKFIFLIGKGASFNVYFADEWYIDGLKIWKASSFHTIMFMPLVILRVYNKDVKPEFMPSVHKWEKEFDANRANYHNQYVIGHMMSIIGIVGAIASIFV